MTRRDSRSSAALLLSLLFTAGVADPAGARADATVTLTPPPGTIVHPGDKVEIRFAVENGRAIRGAIFHVKDRVERMEGMTEFVLSYDVPGATAGLIPINVETFGPGSETYRASSRLVVRPAQPFVSIAAMPNRADISVGE